MQNAKSKLRAFVVRGVDEKLDEQVVQKYVKLAAQMGFVTIEPGVGGELPRAVPGPTFLSECRDGAYTSPQKSRMAVLEARVTELLADPSDLLLPLRETELHCLEGGKRTLSIGSEEDSQVKSVRISSSPS
jgi:hypothetical protein